jgi:hypothetical protein
MSRAKQNNRKTDRLTERLEYGDLPCWMELCSKGQKVVLITPLLAQARARACDKLGGLQISGIASKKKD